ncbi:MAG: glycosyltransferase [Elusimicrobia bacterium]|nr:glycosyltransferase [Elusimicrobiota bacterium]
MPTPLLSVIVPAYDMAAFTRLTVESLLAQDYPALEIIVVDDGSKDDTPAVLASFGGRIRSLRQANGGASRARNHGFSVSRGEFVAFADCDDLWEPRKARRAAQYLREHPQAGMVHSHAYWIDAAGRIVGPRSFPPRPSGRIFSSLVLGNQINNSTPVMRRSVFERAGGWDESIFIPADWDLWLRLAREAEVGFIPEVLSRSRLTSNFTGRHIELARREHLHVLGKYREEIGPQVHALALANMHYYLSRLHAGNGDFAAAHLDAQAAARLAPGRRDIAAALLAYRLGRPVNRALESFLRFYDLLSCRWHILRDGARLHPVEAK